MNNQPSPQSKMLCSCKPQMADCRLAGPVTRTERCSQKCLNKPLLVRICKFHSPRNVSTTRVTCGGDDVGVEQEGRQTGDCSLKVGQVWNHRIFLKRTPDNPAMIVVAETRYFWWKLEKKISSRVFCDCYLGVFTCDVSSLVCDNKNRPKKQRFLIITKWFLCMNSNQTISF